MCKKQGKGPIGNAACASNPSNRKPILKAQQTQQNSQRSSMSRLSFRKQNCTSERRKRVKKSTLEQYEWRSNESSHSSFNSRNAIICDDSLENQEQSLQADRLLIELQKQLGQHGSKELSQLGQQKQVQSNLQNGEDKQQFTSK